MVQCVDIASSFGTASDDLNGVHSLHLFSSLSVACQHGENACISRSKVN